MTDQAPEPTGQEKQTAGEFIRDNRLPRSLHGPVARLLAAARAEGERAGAEAQRKAVVAYLRRVKEYEAGQALAAEIEAGAHEPEKP